MNDCELNEEIILMQAREIKTLRARNEKLEKVAKESRIALTVSSTSNMLYLQTALAELDR